MSLFALPILSPICEVAVRLQLQLGYKAVAMLRGWMPVWLPMLLSVLVDIAPAAELQTIIVLNRRCPEFRSFEAASHLVIYLHQ